MIDLLTRLSDVRVRSAGLIVERDAADCVVPDHDVRLVVSGGNLWVCNSTSLVVFKLKVWESKIFLTLLGRCVHNDVVHSDGTHSMHWLLSRHT